MLMKKFIIVIMSVFIFHGNLSAAPETSRDSTVISRDELTRKYPSIEEGSKRKENKKILCPFLRMLHRSGSFDASNKDKNVVWAGILELSKKAREFGCGIIGCGAVATAVSAGQLTHISDIISGKAAVGYVNMTNLTKARGVAHECGFTFKKGGKEVNNKVRAKTLDRLKKLADAQGRLKFEHIEKVKLEICKKQGVEITKAGAIEVKLIFGYLGGKDRGHIDYDDVVRLLHAEMPKIKSKKLL